MTTKGIDDLCLKEFVEAGAMAVRRCRKEDLRRIAKATGGTLVSSLANLEGEESFEPSYLGTADEVVQELGLVGEPDPQRAARSEVVLRTRVRPSLQQSRTRMVTIRSVTGSCLSETRQDDLQE